MYLNIYKAFPNKHTFAKQIEAKEEADNHYYQLYITFFLNSTNTVVLVIILDE